MFKPTNLAIPYSLEASIFWHVEDQHEFDGVVVGHELISNGLNLRRRVHMYALWYR